MKETRLSYAEQADHREYERVEAVLAESGFADFVDDLRTNTTEAIHPTWDDYTPKDGLNPLVTGSAIGAVIFAGFVFAVVLFGAHGAMAPIARAMGLS